MKGSTSHDQTATGVVCVHRYVQVMIKNLARANAGCIRMFSSQIPILDNSSGIKWGFNMGNPPPLNSDPHLWQKASHQIPPNQPLSSTLCSRLPARFITFIHVAIRNLPLSSQFLMLSNIWTKIWDKSKNPAPAESTTDDRLKLAKKWAMNCATISVHCSQLHMRPVFSWIYVHFAVVMMLITTCTHQSITTFRNKLLLVLTAITS